jgi:hypothetical protein
MIIGMQKIIELYFNKWQEFHPWPYHVTLNTIFSVVTYVRRTLPWSPISEAVGTGGNLWEPIWAWWERSGNPQPVTRNPRLRNDRLAQTHESSNLTKLSTHALAKKSIVSNRTEREISHESSGALFLVFRRICACSPVVLVLQGLGTGDFVFLSHSVWQHLAGKQRKQARWASSVVSEFWIFGDSQGLLSISHLRFVDVRAIIFGVLGGEGVGGAASGLVRIFNVPWSLNFLFGIFYASCNRLVTLA